MRDRRIENPLLRLELKKRLISEASILNIDR